MLPYFNTSGPCIPSEHYMLPPERRLHHVLALIEARRYFTLHAGRQTGKTTSAMWLEDHLGGSGRWRALWLDLETAREKPEVTRAMTAILKVLDDALAARHPQQPRPSATERAAMLATPARFFVFLVEGYKHLPPHPRNVEPVCGDTVLAPPTRLAISEMVVGPDVPLPSPAGVRARAARSRHHRRLPVLLAVRVARRRPRSRPRRRAARRARSGSAGR